MKLPALLGVRTSFVTSALSLSASAMGSRSSFPGWRIARRHCSGEFQHDARAGFHQEISERDRRAFYVFPFAA